MINFMKITVAIIVLLITNSLCFSDYLFLGIMELESYQNLELGVSAFANVCRIPELNDQLKAKSAQLTALPVLSGFEKNKRIRIIQVVDPNESLSEINPANVAIIPIMDGGKEIEDILDENYQARSYWRSNISVYDKPVSTNLFELVAVAKEGRFLLTSRAKPALLWTSENKKLISAPPLTQKGTIKFLINPQRTAAVLNAKGDSALLKLFKPVEILQELEMCNLALTLDSQSLTMTAVASPLEGTPLTTLAMHLRTPDSALLNAIPDDAFLESISKCEEPEIWNRFAMNLQNYLLPSLTEMTTKKLFTGERVQYLAPSSDRRGLIFVQIAPLTDAEAVQTAIATLGRNEPADTPVTLERITMPDNAEQSHLCFKMNLKENDAKTTPSVIYTILSLFIQHAYLELQIKDNQLITVVGPKDSIKDALSNMANPPGNMNLLKEISVRNESFNENLNAGTKLELTKLLRFTASIIPHISQQQLAILPDGGYGSTFGLIKENSNTIKGSFQISADELSAMKNIGTNGRELMQKLLMSMLMQRIENIDMKKPNGQKQPAND